jgi:VanZ family protein
MSAKRVELTQTMLPGRYCTISDVLTNGTGALLGG